MLLLFTSLSSRHLCPGRSSHVVEQFWLREEQAGPSQSLAIALYREAPQVNHDTILAPRLKICISTDDREPSGWLKWLLTRALAL